MKHIKDNSSGQEKHMPLVTVPKTEVNRIIVNKSGPNTWSKELRVKLNEHIPDKTLRRCLVGHVVAKDRIFQERQQINDLLLHKKNFLK